MNDKTEFWNTIANERLEKAKTGSAILKQKKGHRFSTSSNFIDKCPTLQLNDDVNMYLDASDAFIIGGSMDAASDAIFRAASIYKHEIPNSIAEAADLYYKAGNIATNREKQRVSFENSVSAYCDNEDYFRAARVQLILAKNEEALQDRAKAIQEYRAASQFFKAVKMDEQVICCCKKVAQLLVDLGEYTSAAQEFFDLGLMQLKFNLQKYHAKKSFFLSCLLLLASSDHTSIDALAQIKKAKNADFRFDSEYQFLNNILGLITKLEETNDETTQASILDEFADHLFEYNQIFSFDHVELKLLNQVHTKYFNAKNVKIK